MEKIICPWCGKQIVDLDKAPLRCVHCSGELKLTKHYGGKGYCTRCGNDAYLVYAVWTSSKPPKYITDSACSTCFVKLTPEQQQRLLIMFPWLREAYISALLAENYGKPIPNMQ
jgi:hypothetical protein